jgi:flavin reductase (DIM6/NTAB) family NADH-FMN oxidoreductase RutF
MELEVRNFYKALAPRPVVLISTRDKKGNVNAAPFSFVMPVSMDPPLVAFASARERDTLDNIRETKEFVINIPTEEILGKLWVCGGKFPKGVDEIKKSGLSETPSDKVKPPRIRECVAWFECMLFKEFKAGDHAIILGEVLTATVGDRIINEKGNLDIRAVNVLMHLGGPEFAVPKKVVNAE